MGHVDAIVELFRRLRRAGLVHGDTKATNFVVATDGLTVLDLDAMRRPRNRRLRERGQARDVERFCANWPKSTELPSVLVAAGL
jgi:RIO-like serine/threonine protein kinase